MYCPYYHGTMMGGWGWLMMTAGTLLIVGLIILGVVLLVKYTTRGTTVPAGEAERILAERYARGDIDDQDYQQRLNVLRGGPSA